VCVCVCERMSRIDGKDEMSIFYLISVRVDVDVRLSRIEIELLLR
jgi:hypothetical protein